MDGKVLRAHRGDAETTREHRPSAVRTLDRRDPVDYQALPDDALERRKVLEKRATPSDTKPPLPPHIEAMLADCDERSAAAYTDFEELTYQMSKAADKVGGSIVPRYGLDRPDPKMRRARQLDDYPERTGEPEDRSRADTEPGSLSAETV